MKRRILIFLAFMTAFSSGLMGQSKNKQASPLYDQLAIFVGSWIPTRNASTLGNQFVLGFRVGQSIKKFKYDWNIDFRLGQSMNRYTVKYNDSLVSSQRINGIYTGIGVSYDFVTKPIIKWYATMAFGIDGFVAIREQNPTFPTGKSIGSFNYKVGIGFRNYPHCLNDRAYFSTELCFNFVNYQNEGGTPLNGNTFTLRLILGFQRIYEKHTLKDRRRTREF
jgi:hypothetical protein